MSDRQKRNLRGAALAFAGIAAVLVILAAQRQVVAQDAATISSDPSAAANQSVGDYWTPERMASATPKELFVDLPGIPQAAGSVQQLESGAAPGLVPGFDPADAASQLANRVFNTLIPAQPMTSPPFVPPGFPDDFGNYSPFQRYTHFGNYFTYPVSTVGKMFFVIPGQGNFVCSGSVIARNTIATAGHCVYSPGIGFHTNLVFCPSYTPGGCIRGIWDWTGYAATSGAWAFQGAPERDYARFVTAGARPGTNGGALIGNITGRLGRAFNWPTRQAEFAWGYPAASPFPGYHIITVTSTEWYNFDFTVMM
jgi:hypothetical protein